MKRKRDYGSDVELETGHIVRCTNENWEYSELWSNDGDGWWFVMRVYRDGSTLISPIQDEHVPDAVRNLMSQVDFPKEHRPPSSVSS